MDTPFIFGKLAGGEEFTNRKEETDRLVTNFNSGINTILISPRRWGKSSLVNKVAKTAVQKNKKLRICFIDLFNVKSEEEFYQHLAQEVMKSVSSKWEETVETAKTFLATFVPKLSFAPDPNSELSVSLDWNEVKKKPDEIIDLAERVAEKKGIKIIICIDEFQNLAEYENPLALQKKLRSHWQKHKHVSYCLYGSRHHMMVDVFSNSRMPFYKFGDLIFLEKIKKDDWIKFIVKRFSDTKKNITEKEAQLIAELAECHSYYVQQLAQQAWLRTSKKCSEAIIHESHESIMMQLSLLFQGMTDALTSTQANFLHAVLNGTEQLTSAETLKEYRLGTSANVGRIKQALINKDLINIHGSRIEILDPYYAYWLKTQYFKNMF
jgi:AAA+ ATPase superfamily predicted ATPase